MNNRFLKLSYKQILIYSGILTIALFLILRIFNNVLITPAAPDGIVSFELAKNMEMIQSILSSWDFYAKINASLSLGIDFLFLIVYALFFATACYLVAQSFSNNKWIYNTGMLLAKLQFVAGLFDAIENIALTKLLLGSSNNTLPLIAYYFASTKFLILIIGIIYIIVGLLVSFFQRDAKPA